MSAVTPKVRPPQHLAYNEPGWLDTIAAWVLALLWLLPLAYAVWTAFHPAEYSTRFELLAPLTLDNFRNAWAAAPFARYFLNTPRHCCDLSLHH